MEDDINNVEIDVTSIETDINQQDDRITIMEETVINNTNDIAG